MNKTAKDYRDNHLHKMLVEINLSFRTTERGQTEKMRDFPSSYKSLETVVLVKMLQRCFQSGGGIGCNTVNIITEYLNFE